MRRRARRSGRTVGVTVQPTSVVEFRVGDTAPVVRIMRELAAAHAGWLNLQPDVDVADVPDAGSPFGRLLTAAGPPVPLASWVPGELRRGRVADTSLGLQHPGGRKAVWQLRDAGITVPEGWRVRSDHPRRGLVLLVPADADPEVALDWLVRAALALTEMVLPDVWRAAVYRG
jgi:hypothetical protein